MIKNFTIYGERCSGTNFLEAIFTGESYFHKNKKPAFDLPLTWDFGNKHFFGFNDEDIVNNGDDTLFIGIVRNPYDWITSLFIKKHHIPQVNFSPKNFLFGEWYSIEHNIESDNFLEEYMKDRNLLTGVRYENIFQLRKNKLEYLYSTMPNLAKNYMLIRYEDLCDNSEKIVNEISDRFNLPIINKTFIKTKIKQPSNILNTYENQITNSLDWNTENLLGYTSKPKNIEEFYQYNNIDASFDAKFYESIYPNTKDFYQPHCQENNIDDAHRLFYHYKKYGIYAGAKINIGDIAKDYNNIIIEEIVTKDIERIIPVDDSFKNSYDVQVGKGKTISSDSQIVVVALARDCEQQLQNSIDLISSLETKQTNFFVYENDSKDATKDILKHNEITSVCENRNLEDTRDRSYIRTYRLAEFRNKCVGWVQDNHSNSDYVIVLDLDADLGFSVNGIYNSIGWLNDIPDAGGMGSYSLLLNKNNCVHYDSFAVRLNDWKPSEELDHNNIWFKNWHPIVGSDPVQFYSCFGGLAVYKTQAFLCGKYDGKLGSEHVDFHKSLKENGWNMYLNPSSRFFSVFNLLER